MTTRVVGSIAFSEEGPVLVSWMEPTDVRNGGLLMMTKSMEIHPGEDGKDYGEEIEDVKDAIKRLLADALEDFEATADIAVAPR